MAAFPCTPVTLFCESPGLRAALCFMCSPSPLFGGRYCTLFQIPQDSSLFSGRIPLVCSGLQFVCQLSGSDQVWHKPGRIHRIDHGFTTLSRCPSAPGIYGNQLSRHFRMVNLWTPLFQRICHHEKMGQDHVF